MGIYFILISVPACILLTNFNKICNFLFYSSNYRPILSTNFNIESFVYFRSFSTSVCCFFLNAGFLHGAICSVWSWHQFYDFTDVIYVINCRINLSTKNRTMGMYVCILGQYVGMQITNIIVNTVSFVLIKTL